MKKRTKYILYISILVLVVIVIVITLASSLILNNGEKEYITQAVERSVIEKTVSSTATLTSEIPINLNFEISGRINDIRVQEGMDVAEGDILASIDDDKLNIEVEKAKIALDQARAISASNDDVIDEAEITLENAKDLLDVSEELEDQKVDAAKDNYERASEYQKDMQGYYDEVIKSGPDSVTLAQAKSQLTQAKNSAQTAKEAYETAKDMRDLNITSVENSIKSAEAKLDTLKSTNVKLNNDSSVQLAKKNYDLALSMLQKATLTSPVNGKVTKINYKVGEILGSSLNSAGFGEIMTSDFILEADISESDITFVKLGQKANVSFDSLNSEETLNAKVVEIAPSSTLISGVVYYKVKLKLDNLDSRLKSGMSADVDILVDRKENALGISSRAINSDNEDIKTVKIIDEEDEIKEVKVETGLYGDEGVVEITKGLSQGDVIILQEKTSLLEQ